MPPLKFTKNGNKKKKKSALDQISKPKLEDKQGCMKSFLKVLFSHLGLMLIVAIYAIAGAYALISIESEEESMRYELKKIAALDVQDSKQYIIKYAWFLNDKKHSKKEYLDLMVKPLNLFNRFVVDKAINNNYDGDAESWNYDWTFAKSLLFTVTTMGAIGYGHIFPRTSTGQIFTMYYGMLGVPLLLLFLANIGDFMARSFKYIYSRLCCRLCRIRRKVTELRKDEKLQQKILWKEEIGTEEFMPTSQVDVPITINLVVIFVYLMVGGAIFSQWENWTMVEAIYFTFITLTTIGFGDFVPGNSFSTSGDQAFVSMMKMLVTIVFCLLGMALVSMAINLMQEQLVGKAKWLSSQIGSQEDDPDAKKYQIKKSPEGTVTCTPDDDAEEFDDI